MSLFRMRRKSMLTHCLPDRARKSLLLLAVLGVLSLLGATPAMASEADLVLPDLGSQTFLGINGHDLLLAGLVVCLGGVIFGMIMYTRLKNLPVHRSMREISELIYETCKTYLITQGKFILLLELFIGLVMIFYFWGLRDFTPTKVAVILLFSLIGIAGSYGVAWFGIRVNTFANSRSAFASLGGKPSPPTGVAGTLLFALIGIAGSYGVAWFGIRVNTFANSRSAFASLGGKPYPTHALPLQAGPALGLRAL